MLAFFRRTKLARKTTCQRATSSKPRLEALEERCLLSTYPTVVLGDHPAAYYRLGEASGSTAVDSSGNSHTGTYLGGVTPGQPGALTSDSDTSVGFNGVDSIVDTNFQPDDPSFTIEAWVKPTDAIAHEWVIAGRSGGAQLVYNAWDGISQPVHATPGYAGIAFADGSRFDVTLSTATLPLNQWSYLAGTWDNATKSLDIYVNGMLDSTQTFAGKTSQVNPPWATFQIGAFDEALHGGRYIDQYFQGGIDEVAYYSYALTSAQVQQHYKAGTELPDIAAQSLAFNTAQGGMDFSYQVTGAALPQDAAAFLYWASGPTENDILDLATASPITISTTTPLDTPITEHIASADIFPAPAGATHLLVVVDPSNAITESDETNNVVSLLVPDIGILSATTADSHSVTYTFDITGATIVQPLHVGIYRSADANFDPSADLLIGTQRITITAPGRYTMQWQGDLPIDPAHKFVLVVADPDNTVIESNETNNTADFRKYLLGVVTHGFSVTFPAWVNEMAGSLRAVGYDDVIPFNWAPESALPLPFMTQLAGARMANLVLNESQVFPPGPIDVHFIGHSRGAVVISQALLHLEANERTGTLPDGLQRGYTKMTMLDPHPASNDWFPQLSASSDRLGQRATLEVFRFQVLARDPQVIVPGNVDEAENYFQHTDHSDTPSVAEQILNLWGQATVVNRSARPVIPHNLTGPGIGHSEVHDYYQNFIIPQLVRGTLSTQVKSSDWQNPAQYPDRTHALRDYLFARVSDDDSVDVLKGQKGQDWYFADLKGPVKDKIKNLTSSELAVELARLERDD